jgi:signal transduction histidine kinase
MPFDQLCETSVQPSLLFPQGQLAMGISEKAPAVDDLVVAFSSIREEVHAGVQGDFRMVLEGRPRPLDPHVWNEVYRVAREALVNAFRHSKARFIEVNLVFASEELRIAVRDDGQGMSPEIFRSGDCAHKGLSWMRHMAERIGAKLKLSSRIAAGTTVELSIPGHIAYRPQPWVRRVRWANLCEVA